MNADTKANREYKNSVFTLLFGEKDKLIELYNAIFNANYGLDTDIEITTLQNILFMGKLNDISFVIDGKIIVLIEHQSTINKNMCLRMLLYIARIYEKICDSETLYRTEQITIPRPEFIVLYNGKDEMPDEQILKLSDMFAEYGETNPIELELVVKVYNINNGRNPQMAKRSVTLSGYELFISKVREFEKEADDLKEAISQAINYCIERNVLETFLKTHGREVLNMMLTEWKFEDALRVSREEGQREEKIKFAQKMKDKRMSVNEIAELTELTVDEILKYCK
ncbi:MAG: Rpn family recombination-promoting nuclease/putative transposase [Chitinispirillales bacterium]|jgi:predicted transposase/invertase (TIGR01784 family)|nr:Rpn family recombination-promoting nuclease/putative transposase [Chitinispirillales bacterium]